MNAAEFDVTAFGNDRKLIAVLRLEFFRAKFRLKSTVGRAGQFWKGKGEVRPADDGCLCNLPLFGYKLDDIGGTGFKKLPSDDMQIVRVLVYLIDVPIKDVLVSFGVDRLDRLLRCWLSLFDGFGD